MLQLSSHSHILEEDRAGAELLYVYFIVKRDFSDSIRLKLCCIY